MTKASDNAYPSLLVVEGSAPSSPSAGNQRVYIDSSSHHLSRKNSSGTVVDLETNQAAGHITSATARRTSGNITLTSATEASVDTGLDLTLAAATGDIVTVHINGLHGNEAQVVNLDVATIVSSSPVNYFGVGLSSTNQGLLGWSKQVGQFTPISGSAVYVLQSGDISGGNVVLRLRYKTSGSSTLYAAGTTAFQWAAVLVRPA